MTTAGFNETAVRIAQQDMTMDQLRLQMRTDVDSNTKNISGNTQALLTQSAQIADLATALTALTTRVKALEDKVSKQQSALMAVGIKA